MKERSDLVLLAEESVSYVHHLGLDLGDTGLSCSPTFRMATLSACLVRTRFCLTTNNCCREASNYLTTWHFTFGLSFLAHCFVQVLLWTSRGRARYRLLCVDWDILDSRSVRNAIKQSMKFLLATFSSCGAKLRRVTGVH